MNASWAFLAVSIWGALFTVAALARGRRLSAFVVPYFFAGWLTSELALHHVAWQLVASGVFVGLGALDAWPGWLGLVITLGSWAGLWVAFRSARRAAPVLGEALRAGLGATTAVPHARDVPVRRVAHPFRFGDRAVELIRDVPYHDEHRRHRLDIRRPRQREGLCPTLLQVHGGGWVIGQKDQQGLPLMRHLAQRGWACAAINYRLSPAATFPDHLIDVKRAVGWIREHGPSHGFDPDFIVVTGGSAGGHLSALTALTANDPRYQPGFEDVDTSVDACVPFYGIYDFLDRDGVRGMHAMTPFLRRAVMKTDPVEDRAGWDAASPLTRVHAGAPPFFVIHGTHDSLAFVEEARTFVDALRRETAQPVLYAELPGAQHAFDVFDSFRTAHTIDAVTTFVETVRARRERMPELAAQVEA